MIALPRAADADAATTTRPPLAAVHGQAFGDGPARAAAQVGPQLVVGGLDQTAPNVNVDLAHRGERAEATGEQHLALEHVPDPAGDALIEQGHGDGLARLGDREPVHGGREVGVGETQVGPEMPGGVVDGAINERADVGRGEAHRLPTLDPDDHAGEVGGLAPPLSRLVQVPRAGHLHVGLQDEPSLKVNEQMLSPRLDRSDNIAHPRAVTPQAFRIEAGHGSPGQRGAQPTGGSVNGVTFGHGFQPFTP